MEFANEETVTKLLSEKEILHAKEGNSLFTSPLYNLGNFLENIKKEPSPYGEKYIFVK